MKRRWVFVGCALVIALLLSAVAANAATSLFGTRFNVGETVQFKIEDSTTWWWGCCSCAETLVLGWRITDAAGLPLYSVVHDAAVPSSSWLGTWSQTKLDGLAVSAGQYILYVDTSAGTLSRCFTIYDPCAYCNPCSSCVCEQVSSITSCSCKTSLVFVDTGTNCCLPFPFFGLFGGGCFSSRCTTACSSPCTTACSSCP